MKLTGKDIHQAYVNAFSDMARPWDDVPDVARDAYEAVAEELNKLLADDNVTIQAVRCPTCNEMLQGEHAEGHACWLEHESYTIRSDWSTLQKELGE